MRRNRTWVVAGAATCLAAILGLAAVLIVQSQSNRELRASNLRESSANAGLRSANLEVAHQRDLAQANFATARQAVDDYLTRVSQIFSARAGHAVSSQAVARDCPRRTTRISRSRKEATLPFKRGCLDMERAAQITGEIGSKQEAAERWRQAGAIWESLGRSNPTVPRFIVGQARVIRDSALVSRTSMIFPARCLSSSRSQSDTHGHEILAALAETYHTQPRSPNSGIHVADRARLLEKAVIISERMVREKPSDTGTRPDCEQPDDSWLLPHSSA